LLLMAQERAQKQGVAARLRAPPRDTKRRSQVVQVPIAPWRHLQRQDL